MSGRIRQKFFDIFILHFSYVDGMGLGISGWYEVNIEHLSVLTANKYLHGEIAVPRNVVLGKGDMCVPQRGQLRDIVLQPPFGRG